MTAIIVLDVETTGKDRATDQIVELCMAMTFGDLTDAFTFRTWRIKPSAPIHPEATAVHGITAADVATCPTFAELAQSIRGHLDAAEVIVGYNVAFDIDMIQAELARAGLPPLDLSSKQIVDVLRLWHHVEPRTLVAAHEKFCGAPLENAHAAAADVGATARVLTAMIDRFDLSGKPWPELAAIADPFPGRDKWIGPSHHIQWHEDGHPVFAFGKNNGRRLDQVDPGFLRWMLGKDFPPHVKEICHEALTHRGGPASFTAWVAARYPRRISEAA